jgi:archaellum biogenesis ATPase FlaH
MTFTTFIICPSNDIYNLYLKSLNIKTKEEKQSYQRLTEKDQLNGYGNFNVIVIESNHQYFTFEKTVRILKYVNYLQSLKAISPIKRITKF